MSKKISFSLFVVLLVLLMMIGCRPTYTSSTNTIVVKSTDDSGPYTLREALDNAVSGDVIAFDPTVFPPNDPGTIELLSPLPELDKDNVTIDASNAGVILNGKVASETGYVNGIVISSDNNVIRGLQIVNFSDVGIRLYGDAQHNVIGGDRNIGSPPLGQGNLISANGYYGIGLWGPGTSENTIRGNNIGTDIEAREVLGQSIDGIHLENVSNNQIIDNVIGGNSSAGVYMCCAPGAENKIEGNWIGVGSGGENLGNGWGVLIDRTTHNTIGAGNTISFNKYNGITFWEDSPENTITQNRILENDGRGIWITDVSGITLLPPQIITWDVLQPSTLDGVACPGCTVEIFSDWDGQGEIFEGRATADATTGYFRLTHGPMQRPNLTCTATDSDGTTSLFSSPTHNQNRDLSLQTGNHDSYAYINTLCAPDLVNDRIGSMWGYTQSTEGWGTGCILQGVKGLTTVRFAFNDVEDWPSINWDQLDTDITPEQDEFVTELVNNGITITYLLPFWDKANHPGGWDYSGMTSRFTTEEEIERYLDFVQFIVHKFKGRIHYYELWNEPDVGSPIQRILPKDYIELVKRVEPVIRQEDPDAKIVVGSVSYTLYTPALDYLEQIIQSEEIMPIVDVVAWHPLYGTSPDYPDENDYEYYYYYPQILERITQKAAEQGFKGEFHADEIGWCSPEMSDCGAAQHVHTSIVAAKYVARAIVTHLGKDVSVNLGGLSEARLENNITVSNLATILDRAKAAPVAVDQRTGSNNDVYYKFDVPDGTVGVQTTRDDVVIHTFSIDNDTLVALWTNGPAVDDDPGVSAKLTFSPASSAPFVQQVIGIDPLHSFQQTLLTREINGELVAYDFLVKDYPIILRLVR